MNQHYVPRIYLKHFAIIRNKEYYVEVYDQLKMRAFNTNITNICVERDLYTLDDNRISENPLIIEKIYSDGFEPMYGRVYQLLTNDNVFQITHLQRIEILIAVFQFFVRNPQIKEDAIKYHLEQCKFLYNEALRRGKKGLTYMDEDFSFKEYSEQDIINFLSKKINTEYKEKHIGGIAQIGTIHEHGKLEVIKTNDIDQFITSDNPLIIDNITDNQNVILDRMSEFTLPLNPSYALRIYHDNTREINTIQRTVVPNGSVGSINNNLAKQANRFIIGRKESLKSYFEIRELLESTADDLKIDVIAQVLALYKHGPNKFPQDIDNHKLMQLMESYLEKYGNGTATPEDLNTLYKTIQEENLYIKKLRVI